MPVEVCCTNSHGQYQCSSIAAHVRLASEPMWSPLIKGCELNVQGNVPHRAFALLAAPRFLYGTGGTPSPEPMKGVGVVFVPPYVKKVSFREAYFFLNQCVRIGSQPLEEERVLFLRSSTESNAIP